MNYQVVQLCAAVLALSIPIVAIVSFSLILIRRKERETELRKTIVENHVDAESIRLLIEKPMSKGNQFVMLRWGCILVGAGIGSLIDHVVGIYGVSNPASLGIRIVCGMGIGMLIAFVIETQMLKKQQQREMEHEEDKE